ncbi:MAG TPA: hypothetical protein V6C58_09860 [Allocoleopsis sp.]
MNTIENMVIKGFTKKYYFETLGGPVCICNPFNVYWSGSLEEGGDYWGVLNILNKPNTSRVISYLIENEEYLIFNSENAGFYLCETKEGKLALLEIFYISEEANINEFEFPVFDDLNMRINFPQGFILFDSSLAMNDLPIEKETSKVDEGVYNFFNSNMTCFKIERLLLKNDDIHLEGILFS